MTEGILAGVVITVFTAVITRFFANRNSLTKEDCSSRQGACIALVNLKLEHMTESLERLEAGQKGLVRILTGEKEDAD